MTISITPGQRFNKWTVIEVLPKRNTSGHIECLCDCDCGTTGRIVNSYALIKGKSTSCGCSMIGRNGRPSPYANIKPGQKFNHWMIVEILPRGTGGPCMSICDCDCGTTGRVVGLWEVVNGHSKSCGCLRADAIARSTNMGCPLMPVRNEALSVIQTFRKMLADPMRMCKFSEPDNVERDFIAACVRINKRYGPFTEGEIRGEA